jgi:flavin-binding protein dodecin
MEFILFVYQKKIIPMSVIKVIEIMAESKESWEEATESGIKKASESVKNIRSAHVQNQSVTVENGDIKKYRVNLKLTFEVD